MPKVCDIKEFLETRAPLSLSEDWDNVGLLVGDSQRGVSRVMTCLTVTSPTVDEAIDEKADLIVAHHPMPFRSLKRLTNESTVGRMMLRLIENRVSIYSAHTAFDSCKNGINEKLSALFALRDVKPLKCISDVRADIGVGRFGTAEESTLRTFARLVKKQLKVPGLHVVGDANQPVKKVAIACGSAGQFLTEAIENECDTFITGETSFHTCLEAQSQGVGLILPGHYASERFAMEDLVSELTKRFTSAKVWASRSELDPLIWVD